MNELALNMCGQKSGIESGKTLNFYKLYGELGLEPTSPLVDPQIRLGWRCVQIMRNILQSYVLETAYGL